ncbi:DUF1453 family protein [Paenibacillus tyrfis]|uniref:DUF1453 domain-containing protein n=1 Tax=Paenibacillus tyrfis TaxID=1501230 RepID=A0A081P1U7_9BACL|nr:DUF1453 family protein [Paenibacillus tyrfis]KEQ24670.1 hypothetical protein ET33_08025 [Paenibacillus tyrfis]
MTDGLILLVLLIWIALRQLRERPVKIATLWIVPALMVYVSLRLIGQDFTLTPYAPLVMTAGAAVGAVVGIARGALTKFRIHAATGEVVMKGSVAGIAIWFVLLGVRWMSRHFGDGAELISGALLMVGLGSVVFRRLWIYRAYRKLKG